MAEQTRNVSTYEIDAAKAEDSVKRLNALLVQLRETQEKGGDTSAVQAAIAAETAGLDNLTGGQKKAADAGGELFKRKRDLVDILSAVNPALGQTGRQLLEVGDALVGVSGSGAKWNLALLGITAAVGGLVLLYQQWTAAAKAAAEQQERLAEATLKAREAASTSQAATDTELARMGAFTPAKSAEAEAQTQRLRRELGIPEEQARKAAALAAAGGFGGDDAELLAGLGMRGKLPTDVESARAALGGLRTSGAAADVQRELERFRGSEAAQREMARAGTAAQPDLSGVNAAIDAVYAAMREAGTLPERTPGGGAVTVDQFRRRVRSVLSERAAGTELPPGVTPDAPEIMEAAERTERILDAERPMPGAAPLPGPAGEFLGQQRATIVNQYINHVGTQYNQKRDAREKIQHPNLTPFTPAGAGTHNTPGY